MQTMTPVRTNPYIGPRSFQTGEKIYGRDRELKDLLGLLIAERIVLLNSPSGAGKTSLINAGLIPTLIEREFTVLPIMRVSLSPPAEFGTAGNRYVRSLILSLEEGLPADQQVTPAELATLSFDAYLKRYEQINNAQDDLVLIFDQFEEILTIDPTDTQAKHEFFSQVGEALRNQRKRWALFSMREDYVASLQPFVRPLPTRLNTSFHLGLLDYNAARAPIQQPARAQGVDFADDAARQLIDDLRRVQVQLPNGDVEIQLGPTVEPVQLQVVCRRLWSGLSAEATTITLAELREVGNVDEALSSYYGEQVLTIAQQIGGQEKALVQERAIREWFDRQLITAHGVRSQVLQGLETSSGLDNSAIWSLIDVYIVRAEKRRGMNWFELSHDRMITPVRRANADWFVLHLSTLQRQADIWNRSSRPDGLLLKDAELTEAERWSEANAANLLDHERDFLADCRHAREIAKRSARQARRIRNLAVGASILSAVATIAFVIALIFYNRSVIQTRYATARGLAANATTQLDNDPEQSVLLARQSVLATYDYGLLVEADTLATLQAAVQRSRVRETLRRPGAVAALAYSPDGRFLAVGGVGDVLRWDQSSMISTTLKGAAQETYAVAYSADGTRIAAADANGALVVWNAASASEELRFSMGEDNLAFGLDFSPDGMLLAAAGLDGGARVFDLVSRSEKFNLKDVNAAYLIGLDISPDGKHLATAGSDGFARIWALDSGQQLSGFDHQTGVAAVRFSPDGRRLASTDSIGVARIWDLANERVPQQVISSPSNQLQSLDYSPDGTLLATASTDGTVQIWEIASGTLLLALNGHDTTVRAVAFRADGDELATASDDSTVRLWDLTAAYPRGLRTMAFSSTGLIAVGGGDGAVRLVDPATRKLRMVMRYHAARINQLVFSADGSRLAVVSADGMATLWDTQHDTPLVVYDKHPEPERPDDLRSVAFSLGADRVASGGDRGRVHIWQATTGETLQQFMLPEDQRSPVSWLMFSPKDPDRLLMADQNPSLLMWDLTTGSVAYQRVLNTPVLSAVFSNDGVQIAVTLQDGSIELWEAADGTQLKVLTGHKGGVNQAVFSPNGRFLATASADTTVKLWELATGTERLSITQPAAVTGAAFSADGATLATVSTDGGLRLYPLDPSDLLNPDPLLALAVQRLTRLPTAEECKQYRLEPQAGCL